MSKGKSSLSYAIKYIKVRFRSGKYRSYDKKTIDVILQELQKLEERWSEDNEAEFNRMIEEYMTPSDRDIQYKNHTYKQARIKGTKY